MMKGGETMKASCMDGWMNEWVYRHGIMRKKERIEKMRKEIKKHERKEGRKKGRKEGRKEERKEEREGEGDLMKAPFMWKKLLLRSL